MKKSTTSIFVALALALVALVGLAGCWVPVPQPSDGDSRSESYDRYFIVIEAIEDVYGYESHQISTYEKLRAMDLLNERGFTDYDSDSLHRDYHYTAEDYATIEGLDESYLYGFFILSNEEDANEMARGLGYEDLDDFMVQNGYVDDEGNPSWEEWSIADTMRMAALMDAEYAAKVAEEEAGQAA